MFKKTDLKNKFGARINVIEANVSPSHILSTVAITLVLAGGLIVMFPKFFALLAGVFLVFFGLVFSVVAWKIYKFKKKFDGFVSKVNEGTVVVSQMDLSDMSEAEDVVVVDEEEKITWH